MKLQMLLKEACEQAGLSYRNDYSGRAMYGRACVGISGGARECDKVRAGIVTNLMQELHHTTSDDEEGNEAFQFLSDATTIVDQLFNDRQDSMGVDIIMYWPDLKPLSDGEMGYGDEESMDSLEDFVAFCKVNTPDQIVEEFDNGSCTQRLREEVYSKADKGSPEPFRSAMINLGFPDF